LIFRLEKSKLELLVKYDLTQYPNREFVRQRIIDFSYNLPKQVTLIHDNAAQFISIDFSQYNINAVKTSVAAPNMNTYIERLIGSIRREAFDHFLLFSEKQIKKIATEYVRYYNHYRVHQGLGNIPECGKFSTFGKIQKNSVLWDLHHHYFRSSA